MVLGQLASVFMFVLSIGQLFVFSIIASIAFLWSSAVALVALISIGLIDGFNMMWATVVGIFTGNFDELKRLWDEHWAKVQTIIDTLGEKFNTMKDVFTDIVTKIGEQFGFMAGFWASFQTNVNENIEAVKGFINGLWTTILQIWTNITNLKWPTIDIGASVTGAIDAVGNALENIGGDTGTVYDEDAPDNARAGGGPVEKNKPYKVGEKGEEWFVPNNSGKIIPTHMPLPSKYIGGGAASSVVNEVSVSFGDVTITNPTEGAMFEQRVEKAVRKALS
jgi:hypothetical protein